MDSFEEKKSEMDSFGKKMLQHLKTSPRALHNCVGNLLLTFSGTCDNQINEKIIVRVNYSMDESEVNSIYICSHLAHETG